MRVRTRIEHFWGKLGTGQGYDGYYSDLFSYNEARMKQYVALLRGINVGGKNLMPGMRGMLLLCIK